MTWPTVATAPSIPRATSRAWEHELGSLDEGVFAHLHRRRTGVGRHALERPHPAHVADDRRDDAERRVGTQERRPLFDVELEVGVGCARCARSAP